MSFPAWSEEVALLRRYDGDSSLSNESLLSILQDLRPRLLMQERLAVLEVYRDRHGLPKSVSFPEGVDDPAQVADWLCHRQPDTLGLVMEQIDPGYGREILATAMRFFARYVARTSHGEIMQYSFDEVLLDLLIDARQNVATA